MKVGQAALIVPLALGIALSVFVLAPLAAAQVPAKAVRVGVLRPGPDDAVFRQNFDPFRQALRENGFVEGTNLTIEYRVRPGSDQEIAGLAGELVRLRVDAILALAPAGVRAAARPHCGRRGDPLDAARGRRAVVRQGSEPPSGSASMPCWWSGTPCSRRIGHESWSSR